MSYVYGVSRFQNLFGVIYGKYTVYQKNKALGMDCQNMMTSKRTTKTTSKEERFQSLE